MQRILVISFGFLFLSGACWADTAGAPDKLPASTVVVSQGGVDLTLADIDSYASEIPADKRAQVFHSPTRIESILRGLLVTRQLAGELLSTGHPKSGGGADFSRNQYQALANTRTEQLRSSFKSKIPDMTELAHERYIADPAMFATPRRVDVRHILISTATRPDGEARALADKLYSELKQNPAQFQQDVDKYSDDKSKKQNHGLIEFANSERTVKPFREAADALQKPGEITGPVKTKYGYHILEAVRVSPAHQPTYAEIKQELLDKLRKDWVAARVQEHLDTLRSKKIDANPDAIASLLTRYLGSGATAGKHSDPVPGKGQQRKSPN